jgi:hypothetical protein
MPELTRAIALRDAGKSATEIGALIGRSRNAVCGRIFRAGLSQAAVQLRKWTAKDDERLLQLRRAGVPMKRIAVLMRRGHATLKIKVQQLREAGIEVPPLARSRHRPTTEPPEQRPISTRPFWELRENERRMSLWKRAKDGAAKLRAAATGVNETLTAPREDGGERIAP